MTVAQLSFSDMGVPHVEAYGRYLDLGNEDGNFGFIVFPMPDVTAVRAYEEMPVLGRRMIREVCGVDDMSNLSRMDVAQMFTGFNMLCHLMIISLVSGLKELHEQEGLMQHITTIGLDLAKRVFQLHGMDHEGRAVLRWQRAAPKRPSPWGGNYW